MSLGGQGRNGERGISDVQVVQKPEYLIGKQHDKSRFNIKEYTMFVIHYSIPTL